MSSLLLRRRAALAAQLADEAEGGGANDGKYVVCRWNVGNTNNRRYSDNFGMSFNNGNLVAPIFPPYSCNFDIGSDGMMYGDVGSNFRKASVSASAATQTSSLNPNMTGTCKAILTSTDCKKFVTKDSGTTFRVWNSGSTVTSHTIPASNWANLACGHYLDGNRDTLQYLIACENGQAGWIGTGASTASLFSSNGGSSWISVKELLFGSQSVGTFKFVTSKFSNDGKYCAVMCSTGSSDARMVYWSSDYCSTFQKVNLPTVPDPATFNNFKASDKFKTWYLAGRVTSGSATRVGTIWKSTDKGNTWQVIKQADAANKGTYFLCNDAGDKLVMFASSASNANCLISYSHDYGATWTSSGFTAQAPLSQSFRWCMSRDSYNV